MIIQKHKYIMIHHPYIDGYFCIYQKKESHRRQFLYICTRFDFICIKIHVSTQQFCYFLQRVVVSSLIFDFSYKVLLYFRLRKESRTPLMLLDLKVPDRFTPSSIIRTPSSLYSRLLTLIQKEEVFTYGSHFLVRPFQVTVPFLCL